MSDPDDWRVWLEKADNDLLNIDNNLSATTIPWDTVCFHSQQAAEKLLKALLVSRGEHQGLVQKQLRVGPPAASTPTAAITATT